MKHKKKKTKKRKKNIQKERKTKGQKEESEGGPVTLEVVIVHLCEKL